MRTLRSQILSLPRNAAKVWQAYQFGKAAPVLVDETLSELYGQILATQEPGWQIARVPYSLSDMLVGVIEFERDYGAVVIYLPGSTQAVKSFRRQQSKLAEILAVYPDRSWSHLLPEILYEGIYHGQPFWVVRGIPGVSGECLFYDADRQLRFLENAVQVITAFHRDTASTILIGDREIQAWVDSPIDAICRSALRYYDRGAVKVLKRLGSHLARRLVGKPARVSWVHGDYWSANLIVCTDTLEVNGIIDWDYASPDGLPALDLLNLAVSAEMAVEACELGMVLVRWLSEPARLFDKYGFMRHATADLEQAGLSTGDILIIFWLHHMHSNLIKSRRYVWNPVWSRNNFVHVLRWIGTLGIE